MKAAVAAFNQEKTSILRDCTTSPINRLHHYFLFNLVEAVAAVILLILVKLSGTLKPRLEARPEFNNLRMFAFLYSKASSSSDSLQCTAYNLPSSTKCIEH